MPNSKTDLLKAQLAGHSLADRAELAQFLLRTFDADVNDYDEAACDDGLARRKVEIQSGRNLGEPAD